MNRQWLGDELGSDVTWRATEDRWNYTPPDGGQPAPDNCAMSTLFNDTWNIHKPQHYMPIYDKLFRPYRDRQIKIMEIGVARGGSLELWRKYFCPQATIVGLDGFIGCTRFNDPSRNIFVRHGHQHNINEDPIYYGNVSPGGSHNLRTIIDEFGKFDIIIDDASHIPSYTLKSFRYLFTHGLVDGGLYVVEDIGLGLCPTYLEPFPEDDPRANDGSPTFLEFVKGLLDVLHHHYQQKPEFGLRAITPGDPECRQAEFVVPLATTLIDGIEVYDGIAAIHRGPRPVPRCPYKGTLDPPYEPKAPISDEWLRRQSQSAQEMVSTVKF